MSATSVELSFRTVVADSDHWSAGSRDAANADTTSGSYDGWVYGQLYAAMRAAGNEFIAEHPDLFRDGELI